MSVTSISAVNSAAALQPVQSNQTSPARQLRQDFDSLSQALGSGDLSGAQKAFSTFMQDLQGIQQSQSGQQTGQGGQFNVQDALSALNQALNSGDLSGAQKAFASLRQDLQAQGAGGHHHHHHHGSVQAPATASQDASTSNTGSTGTTVNTTA